MWDYEVRNLANEHWKWIEELLISIGISLPMPLCKFLYTTAFIHGLKHGERPRNGLGQFVKRK